MRDEGFRCDGPRLLLSAVNLTTRFISWWEDLKVGIAWRCDERGLIRGVNRHVGRFPSSSSPLEPISEMCVYLWEEDGR